MKKLEDIERKNIFEVPDNYFDDLALRIQARTEVLKPSEGFHFWRFSLRYALPVAFTVIVLVWVLKPKASTNVDDLLASVPTEHLIAYLHDSDVSEHDLLETLQLNAEDADTLSNRVNEENGFDGLNELELKSVLEIEL